MNRKLLLIAILVIVITNTSLSQKASTPQLTEFGKYWFVMYISNPDWKGDSATKAKKTQEHLNKVMQLEKEGKFITGGPFPDNGKWTGFLIYMCKTKEEVIKISEADPIVANKIVTYEIHPWITVKGEIKFD